MQTIESLKKKIKSTEDLLSVVKTMKALAAVSIRQYQRAVESLVDYNATVEMGLQIVLKKRAEDAIFAGTVPMNQIGAIIFGSDQGLCGQLNSQMAAYALEEMDKLGVGMENRTVLIVGDRVRDLVEDAGQGHCESLSNPGSTAGITPMVQDIVMILEDWYFNQHLNHIFLFYNQYISGSNFKPHMVHLLPVDKEWLNKLQSKKWESRTLPMFTMEFDAMFLSLIREYLFVSLFRAFAESLASENASRLAAMQNAEKNISERLDEIYLQFHRQRQMNITEELLDIVAGYQVLLS
jgi:F-type H+-transporting ATPase subunit gamma